MDKVEELLGYIAPHMKISGKSALLLAVRYTVDSINYHPFYAPLFTKEIYPAVASCLHCSLGAAEKAIYRAASICWMNGRNHCLNMIIGRTLSFKPAPSELLEYLAFYLINGKPYHGRMIPPASTDESWL